MAPPTRRPRRGLDHDGFAFTKHTTAFSAGRSSPTVFNHDGSADTKATKRAGPRRLRIHEAHDDLQCRTILSDGFQPRWLRRHEGHEEGWTTTASHSRSTRTFSY